MSKRLFDIALSLALLLPALLLSIVALVAVGVALRANPLFLQQRIGRFDRPFTCLKIRTMRPGTAQTATHDAPADAVFPLGRLLRASKIDEMPQLINVLCGDMSLVGPRPCLPMQEELRRLRREAGVAAMRPGITGLAQVRGIDMRDPSALVAVERDYLARHGIALDMVLLVKTLVEPILGKRD